MRLGSRPIVAIAAILTVLFLSAGFWQLSRLRERRAFNASLAGRTVAPPVPISGLPADTASAHYRRVSVAGQYDYSNELILTFRSRDGSPGVNIVTPVRLSSVDTAVLVVRGWIYSPDGSTVDLTKWREGPQLSGSGFVETYPPAREGVNASANNPNAYRWLDRRDLERRFQYPLKPYYVVLTSPPGDTTKNTPPRLTVPPMDDGPHQSYAIQWFSFAAISIIGTILFLGRK